MRTYRAKINHPFDRSSDLTHGRRRLQRTLVGLNLLATASTVAIGTSAASAASAPAAPTEVSQRTMQLLQTPTHVGQVVDISVTGADPFEPLAAAICSGVPTTTLDCDISSAHFFNADVAGNAQGSVTIVGAVGATSCVASHAPCTIAVANIADIPGTVITLPLVLAPNTPDVTLNGLESPNRRGLVRVLGTFSCTPGQTAIVRVRISQNGKSQRRGTEVECSLSGSYRVRLGGNDMHIDDGTLHVVATLITSDGRAETRADFFVSARRGTSRYR